MAETPDNSDGAVENRRCWETQRDHKKFSQAEPSLDGTDCRSALTSALGAAPLNRC
jgi:hypothetical protein